MKMPNYVWAINLIIFVMYLVPLASSGAEIGTDMYKAELYKPKLYKKTLRCGDSEIITESVCFYTSEDFHKQCAKQTIRLINSKKGISTNLPLEGKLVKRKNEAGSVLDAVVTSLGCLKSESGTPYIYLWYVCRWGRDCYEQNSEWQRIFSIDGSNLTEGFKRHDDERLDLLFKELGISESGEVPSVEVIFDREKH